MLTDCMRMWDAGLSCTYHRPERTHMNNQIPVFVYGTLRTGLGNWSWALRGKTLSESPATLAGAYMRDNGGFPFVHMTDAAPEATVIGEVMVIDPDHYDDVMDALDSLEGYYGPGRPNMYDRVLVDVTTDDGQTITAYTYLAGADLYQNRVRHLPRITSGDWSTHDRHAAKRLAGSGGW